MISGVFALLALASTALAQVQINTPAALVECQPVLLSWTGGSAPYYITVLPAGQVSATPLERLPEQSGTSYTWTVDIASGTAISLAITDSTGASNYGSPVTIQQGVDSSCVSASAGTAAGTTPVAVAGGPALPTGLYGFSQSGVFAYPSASYSLVGSAAPSGKATYKVVEGSATASLIEGPSGYVYSAPGAYASCAVSGSSAVCQYSNSAGATTFTAPYGKVTATAAPARRLRYARDLDI